MSARGHLVALGTSTAGLVVSFALGINTYPSWDWLHLDDWMSDPEADWRHARALAHDFEIATVIALVLTAVVPILMLVWQARTRALRIEGNATALSVAADGPGFSVAVGRGAEADVYEVDTLDDARRIAATANVRFPAQGDLRVAIPRRSPFLAVSVLSSVALAYAALVPSFAHFHHGMAMLGVTALPIFVLLVLLAIEWSRDSILVQWGKSGERRASRPLGRSPLERHVQRHLEGRLKEAPTPPRVRIDLFERGSRSVGEWLRHIDAMPREVGYRAEIAPRELLFETLGNTSAPIDIRLAAARVLRLRDGEARTRIRAAVTDEEVGARIDAVTLDELAEAEANRSDVPHALTTTTAGRAPSLASERAGYGPANELREAIALNRSGFSLPIARDPVPGDGPGACLRAPRFSSSVSSRVPRPRLPSRRHLRSRRRRRLRAS